MATQKTPDELVAQAMTDPKRGVVDGVDITQHSLDELIAAARYLKSQTAASKAHRGLRFTKLVPGGSINR